MNRVIMVYAKSKVEFEEFADSCDDIVCYIEYELEILEKYDKGRSKKAKRYRRFLHTQQNWRAPVNDGE